MNILITKTLNKQQKDWLSESFKQFNFTEEPVINSYPNSYQQFVNNHSDKLKTCQQWIFTSRNAVKAVESYQLNFPKTVYAVGRKTADVLRVLSCHAKTPLEENAKGLASYIIKENDTKEKMAFFCGNLRRDELPNELKAAQIPFEEFPVYTTETYTKKIDIDQYDLVLFFSPSGVSSYAESNVFPKDIHYIAIGPTTAKALKKHKIKNIHTAQSPSLEQMMAKAVKIK